MKSQGPKADGGGLSPLAVLCQRCFGGQAQRDLAL